MACWGIVKFCKEEAVEVIPISWYVEVSKECFWPPSSTKKSKIVQLIETCSEPESGWGIYPAILLAKYDDLNIAKKKAQKAVFTSDLSSNSESLAKGRGFRKSKKNPKYRVDDHSSDEEIESSDDEEFPSMPRNGLGINFPQKLIDCNSQNYQHKSRIIPEESPHISVSSAVENESRTSPKSVCANTNSQQATPSRAPRMGMSSREKQGDYTECSKELVESENVTVTDSTPARRSTQRGRSSQRSITEGSNKRSLSTPPDSSGRNILAEFSQSGSGLATQKELPCHCNAEFQKMVLKELTHLNFKLDSVMDSISSINRIKRLETDAIKIDLSRNLKTFYDFLPINDETGMDSFEDWLKNSENYNTVVSELGRVGGSSLPQSIRKILYRIYSNEVARSYSWEGARQKKAFKNLLFARALLESIKFRYNDSTEYECIQVIKGWLVKAKERAQRVTNEQDRANK